MQSKGIAAFPETGEQLTVARTAAQTQ